MLRSLSIRNVVLIDRLDLSFHSGLCVLTGETGTGKSILLDALGLALGARGDSGLVRHGSDQAVVTVEFDVPADHPARALVAEHGLDADGAIVSRRVLSAEGRSRAFVNDQPISVSLLRRLGESLVEVQGQFEHRGLMDPVTHRAALDAYGGHGSLLEQVRTAHRRRREASEALAEAEAELSRARADEDYLQHAVAELDALTPQQGEEAALAESRALLMNREKLVEALNATLAELTGPHGVDDALRAAQGRLGHVAGKASGRLDAVIAALDRAAVEIDEALAGLHALGTDIDLDTGSLEEVEERLFALRDAARKHNCGVDDLPALHERLAKKLATLENRGDELALLARSSDEARSAYLDAAAKLSRARQQMAGALDRAVTAELPPLKMEKARFRTRVEPLDEGRWAADGIDRVTFEVATNPGTPYGPLARIASGGELSRLMLALKVVLSRLGSAPTLVFDEVDSDIGGAVAHAVGERLKRLSQEVQVLVVTHSPQVAARGSHHWRVVKRQVDGGVVTMADELSDGARREEIARMLSDKRVTDAARAAADSLIAGGRP